MRIVIAWVLGLGLFANGLFMLAAPDVWYGIVPGVPDTGPLNPHFVRDIGCAYALVGAALVWLAVDGRARLAAGWSAGFLTLHALVHLWDMAAGREHMGHLPGDLATIFLPAVLAVWLAWSGPHRKPSHQEARHAEMAAGTADRRL